MFDLEKIIRKNILELKPYSSARDEYSGKSAIFLDANENPFETGYNRYPDPYQRELKKKIAVLKGVAEENIFLGNGSDEPIDLLYRIFCEPRKDNVIIPDPTYGMYEVCANINNVAIKNVSLTANFELDVDRILKQIDENTKLIFLCTPNNPTSNSFKGEDVLKIIENFKTGIVVVDEAYIDFSSVPSLLNKLVEFPNLVVLQTFSKAWGLAGIRLGMAFASPTIVKFFSKVKYPYNINILTQRLALETISTKGDVKNVVKEILEERSGLGKELMKLSYVKGILPSDTNFLMVQVAEPKRLYEYLVDHQIIVRDRSKVHLCMGYIRITIGTPNENNKLLQTMSKFK